MPLVARILVVEDSQDIAELLKHYLERAGHEVAMVPAGTDVMPRVRVQVPDLVVLDLMLPGMSGIDVLRTIRHDTRWAALPCIVLTAAGQDAQLREAESLGASEIMSKPFSPRGLLSRVRRYTERDAPPRPAASNADGHSPGAGAHGATSSPLP